MTRDDWVDVQIRTSIDAGELLEFLNDPAVEGSWEENGTVHLYWPRRNWGSQLLNRLQEVLAALDPDGQSREAIQVEPLRAQDWSRLWAESVKRIRVGRRLVIRPSWALAQLQAGDIEFVLDPK